MENLTVLFYGDKISESLFAKLLKNVPDSGKNLFLISDHHWDELSPEKSGLDFASEISSDPNNLIIFCSGAEISLIHPFAGDERTKFLDLISRKNVAFMQLYI